MIAGSTYCPHCGELHSMRVESVNASGYPLQVTCGGCGHKWSWPSPTEFERRRVERDRERARRWREEHPDEHRKEVREWYRERRKREREMKEFDYTWAKCPTCGQDFIKGVHNQTYCSVYCRNTNPRRREYMREYWHRRKKPILKADDG